MEADKKYPNSETRHTEEEGITPPHNKDSDIGAGRQIGDPLSGTLSDRAGDEGFDDDTRIRIDGEKPSEDLDDL